ncbi:MAG: hypothetical protein LBI84_01855 [Propionibacteriaceae bacterium]|nr:hypothetical protein [Propionibacteriaceae bacterium]
MASAYSRAELEESLRAVASLSRKLEKSKATLEAKAAIKPSSSQQTLLDRRIATLQVSESLIQDALDEASQR